MTLRRMDGAPFFIGALTIMGFLGATAYVWPVPVRPFVLTACAAGLVVVYCCLDGPAVSFTVGPEAVTVTNTFLRYEVPRSRIVTVDPGIGVSLRLVLADGRRIAIRAWEPALRRATVLGSARHDQRTRRYLAALDRVAAVPGAGTVERRWRYGNVALALAPFLVAALTLLG